MSKKTNAAKQARIALRHNRRPRRGKKRPNIAHGFNMGIMSNASLIRSVETIAFGEIGCALLRAVGIKPIKLLSVPDDSQETPEASA